jgi:hypothetical protein
VRVGAGEVSRHVGDGGGWRSWSTGVVRWSTVSLALYIRAPHPPIDS